VSDALRDTGAIVSILDVLLGVRCLLEALETIGRHWEGFGRHIEGLKRQKGRIYISRRMSSGRHRHGIGTPVFSFLMCMTHYFSTATIVSHS